MTHFSIAQATALVNSMEGRTDRYPAPVDDEDIAEFMTNVMNQTDAACAGISDDEQETLIAHLNALPPESAAEVFDKIQFFWYYSPWTDTEFGLAQAHLIEWIDWEYRSQIAFDWHYPNLPTKPYHIPEDPGDEEWERCERLRLAQKHVPEWKAAQWVEQPFIGGRVEFIRIPHPWNFPDKETTAEEIAVMHSRTAAEVSETAVEANVEPAGFQLQMRKWIATRLPSTDECIAIVLDVIKSVCLVILIGIAIVIICVLCLIIAQAAAEPTTLLTGALGIKGRDPMTDAIHLKIAPVSTNELYNGRRWKSAKAKQFEKEVALLLSVKAPALEIPEGQLCLHLRVGTTLRFDTSNTIKLVEDCICRHLGINNRRFSALTVVRVPVKRGQEFITFKIVPYRDEEQPVLLVREENA